MTRNWSWDLYFELLSSSYLIKVYLYTCIDDLYVYSILATLAVLWVIKSLPNRISSVLPSTRDPLPVLFFTMISWHFVNRVALQNQWGYKNLNATHFRLDQILIRPHYWASRMTGMGGGTFLLFSVIEKSSLFTLIISWRGETWSATLWSFWDSQQLAVPTAMAPFQKGCFSNRWIEKFRNESAAI